MSDAFYEMPRAVKRLLFILRQASSPFSMCEDPVSLWVYLPPPHIRSRAWELVGLTEVTWFLANTPRPPSSKGERVFSRVDLAICISQTGPLAAYQAFSTYTTRKMTPSPDSEGSGPMVCCRVMCSLDKGILFLKSVFHLLVFWPPKPC